ncbi:Amidase signature enzyme [Candidatus Desulfarcum epimagneticum]|uniref:Amidase signature enzyme n=1 Tax=uncultured Desulfobacteraceae bacterium TaxID=218296 RepID=A0A484HIX5_9BACT|nr:Amidase signature enzyme [uncultured Desulfobacteraceae bacterium]
MKKKRAPLTRETLRRILSEFPTLPWSDHEIDELVSPQMGVITGFEDILDAVEKLSETDLGETGPAGGWRPEDIVAKKPKDPAWTSMPVYELAPLIESGKMSPVDLAEVFLNQIETANGALKAYITVAGENARLAAQKAAEKIKKGIYSGPLHGVPYACKDMFMTQGIRTTGGSKVLEDWIPDRDADAVQKLSAAGGVLLGKLNLHEFAYGATGENKHFGTVPNPFDPSRLAGGSSSGCAAAVAAGLAPYAIGTDTGGSTRAPAALCGVVGLKPTYGAVSLKGAIPFCWSLDHIGIFSRTTPDAALVFGALGRDVPGDPGWTQNLLDSFLKASSHDLSKLRVGVPKSFFFEKTDPEILAATQKAIALFERSGARIIDIDMPPMDHARAVSLIIQLPEALSYHSARLPEKKELYGQDIRAGLALGQFILAEHYVRAKRMMEMFRRDMGRVFENVDLIITPSCPVTAPEMGARFVTIENEKEPAGNAITRFTSFFNLTGNPAISIPSGLHSSGLPMGVQLVGRPFEENTLLKAAHALEKQMGRVKKPD